MFVSLRGILPLVLLLLGGIAGAQDLPQSRLAQLARDPGWLRLGHYEPNDESPVGWRSAIKADFFLAANGRDDPLAELQATLAAMAAVATDDPNTHAQCRFPARRLWLQRSLGNDVRFTGVKCPAFDSWTRSGSISSLSIVFATGYLGNPASYYGHTLLKFNFGGAEREIGLLDASVNFGAIVEKNDDPVTYLVKSVTGGYDAGFSHIHFYFHEHNYGDNELRDLWEYRLDLPGEAVDLIVAHAWEVLGKRFRYGFFRDNCAYRMAEILQVVDGIDVIPTDAPWVVPQALIEKLGKAVFRGKPLLLRVSYIPSRQSVFYRRYRSLAPEEASVLKRVVKKEDDLDGTAFQSLPVASRQAILDTMLDYYQFAANPFEKAPRETKEAYRLALSARYQLPPGMPPIRVAEPESPHLARPIGWVQSAWRFNSATGRSMAIEVRPAYYDALDADEGQVRNSKLVMGDVQFSVYRSRLQIEKLDAIGVDSANPGLSGLPGDSSTAWKVHTGLERARLDCEHCLVARMQGDIGYGRQWSDVLFGAVYLGGAIQDRWQDQGVGFLRATADLILRANERLAMKAAYEHRSTVSGKAGTYAVARSEIRWQLQRGGDIRMVYERDRAHQVSLGVGIYW